MHCRSYFLGVSRCSSSSSSLTAWPGYAHGRSSRRRQGRCRVRFAPHAMRHTQLPRRPLASRSNDVTVPSATRRFESRSSDVDWRFRIFRSGTGDRRYGGTPASRFFGSRVAGDAGVRRRRNGRDVVRVSQGGSGVPGSRHMGRRGRRRPQIPAEDWYKVAMFCTGREFPEERSP